MQDHHAAGFGSVGDHSFFDFFVSKVLRLAVNAQLQIFAVFGQDDFANIFYDFAKFIFDHTPCTGLAT